MKALYLSNSIDWVKKHGLSLLLPLAFVILMVLFYPFWERFEFDTDEGINLIKALLVSHRYHLYTEIWNDQPPLFTYLLAFTLRIFGYTVINARLLVLSLSAVLLWSASLFLRVASGRLAAIAGVCLVILLPFYNMLSVSVMIGLPALAFAMLALLALVGWHHQRKTLWLVLSAGALGMSVFMKLMNGFLAPVFLLGLIAAECDRSGNLSNWRKLLKPAAIWATVFLGICLFCGLVLIGPGNLSQLTSPHLQAQNLEFQSDIPNKFTLAYQLRDSNLFMLLAMLGGAIAVLQKRWLAGYLIAWIAGGYLLLSWHRPVWFHHTLTITVPAAILAGVGISEAIQSVLQWLRRKAKPDLVVLLSATALIVCAALLNQRLPAVLAEFQPAPFYQRTYADPYFPETPFLKKIANHASETRWLVTDLPMFAFRTRLITPPNLAVFSEKRLQTGELSEAEVLNTLRQLEPEQVILGRFSMPEVEAYLAEHYRLLYAHKATHLYYLKGK